MDEIYLHIHNARTLLDLVLLADHEDILFALEKIKEELEAAEDKAEHRA